MEEIVLRADEKGPVRKQGHPNEIVNYFPVSYEYNINSTLREPAKNSSYLNIARMLCMLEISQFNSAPQQRRAAASD
jgi:hypothetical protein